MLASARISAHDWSGSLLGFADDNVDYRALAFFHVSLNTNSNIILNKTEMLARLAFPRALGAERLRRGSRQKACVLYRKQGPAGFLTLCHFFS